MPLAQFDDGHWFGVIQNNKTCGNIWVARIGNLGGVHTSVNHWVLFTFVPGTHTNTHAIFDRTPGAVDTVLRQLAGGPTTIGAFNNELGSYDTDGFKYDIELHSHFER